MRKLLILIAFLFFTIGGKAQYRVMGYPLCGNEKVEIMTDTPAAFGKRYIIMQQFFDSAFYQTRNSPSGELDLILRIDTAGKACCFGISEFRYCSWPFDSVHNVVNKMPAWIPAMNEGHKVPGIGIMRLEFKNKYVIVSIKDDLMRKSRFTDYKTAIIVTPQDDTINCTVNVSNIFFENVMIKMDSSGLPIRFPIGNIKYLATATTVYENIPFTENGKTMQRLMWLKEEGPLSLYFGTVYFNSYDVQSILYSKDAGIRLSKIKYIVKKDDKLYDIEGDNFRSSVKPLISEYPELVKRLEAGKYDNRLSELVKAYNILAQ